MTAPTPVATTDLVAAAWLRTAAGVPSGAVGTTLPRDVAAWADSGFVQVAAVGGTSSYYVPLRSPVVRVTCWAASPTSGKPPWGKANTLAEIIRAACYDIATISRTLTLTIGVHARVLSAYLTGEPVRVPGDIGSYARFSFPLALHWIALP